MQSQNPFLEVFRNVVREGDVTMFPITEVDYVLDDLHKPFAHVLANHTIEGDLCSKLTADAQSAYARYDRYSLAWIQTFEVAVIGHLIITGDDMLENKQQHRVTQQRHMRWNGQLYSMNRIYTLHTSGKSSVLKDYGPLVLDAPKFPDTTTRELNFALIPFRGWRFSAERLSHGRTNVQLRSDDGSSPYVSSGCARGGGGGGGGGGVLVDLHRAMLVTHVGIAAARPLAGLFPKVIREAPAGRKAGAERAGGGARRRGRRWRKKAAGGSVYVIDAVREHDSVGERGAYEISASKRRRRGMGGGADSGEGGEGGEGRVGAEVERKLRGRGGRVGRCLRDREQDGLQKGKGKQARDAHVLARTQIKVV